MSKNMSEHAQAAKAIRKELKLAFPTIKFSVTSECYSMGNSVRINWDNGPTVEMVEAISGKYQYGKFNGMEDIYEHTNSRGDIPQAKFVFENRHVTEDVYNTFFELGRKYFVCLEGCKTIEDPISGTHLYEPARRFLNRYIYKADLTNNQISIDMFQRC